MSIFIFGVVAVALILMLTGCSGKAVTSISPKLDTKVEAVVKVPIQSPEQASKQIAKAGGNSYQFINNQTGGSAILGLIVVCIYLVVRGSKPKKTLKTLTDYLESSSHAVKQQVKYMAMEQGTEKYLNKKVKQWYPK